jgi:thiamine-phosphate pyrophosphorylase
MRAGYPLPRLWLLTDERQGKALWQALSELPRGSGVILRHYSLDRAKRLSFLLTASRIARRRGLVVLTGGEQLLHPWQVSGRYGSSRHRVKGKLLAWPAHNLKEIRAGERSHADFLLLSPLFPTRSHPSVKALGCLGFAKLVRATALPVIALGGVRREDQRRLLNLGAYGWAAIDGLTPANPGRQKRKAVPM